MKTPYIRTLLLGVLASALGCSVSAEKPSTVHLVENGLLPPTLIEGEPGYALTDRMAYHGVPGVSIAVIENARIDWVRHYGVLGVDDPRPVTDSTLFNIGSLSKAVTAVTILSLAEQGLVELDAPVNQQLGDWKLPENEFTRQAAVTPIRLMNHSGGVVFSPPFKYPADALPSLNQILMGQPPARNEPVTVDRVPGTVFQYSNAGFEVLRKLAEDVTGKSFSEIVAEHVFVPARMTNSSIDVPLPPELLAVAAMGHRGDGTPDAAYRRWLPHTAAGGVWTTAADYAALVVEIQRALEGEKGRVISPESAELMVRPHDAVNYGLGVFQRGGGEEGWYVGHLGDGPGFVASFLMDTVGGRGVVILTNGQGGISLVREIALAVETAEQWPDILPSVHAPIDLAPALLDQLAGRYRMGFDTEIVLRLEAGSLWVESLSLPAMRLFAVGDGNLLCRERNGEISYSLDASGRPERVHYHLSDTLGRLPGGPRPMYRLGPDEHTPLGLLLDGEGEQALAQYRARLAEDPASPAVSEGRFNSLGYHLLGKGRINDAIAVFQLNADLYPESANTHDSLGEALMKSGRFEESIGHYRRSLALDPGNANARGRIRQMSEEND